MSSPLSIQLNSIFSSKENLARKEGDLFFKDYNPWIINRILAKHRDTFFYAFLLNQCPDISKESHYEFLLYSIRPAKRFARLDRPEVNPDVDLIKKHYNYNDVRAREALQVLTKKDIEEIRETYRYGEN